MERPEDNAVVEEHESASDEPDFADPENPDEENAILRSLDRKNRLRVLVPLAIVILLSYLLFGGPLKKAEDTTDEAESGASTEKS